MPRRGALQPPAEVRRMFDRIAPRYDVMNRLMTFGRDVTWRRAAARAALTHQPAVVLDVATGTGDLAFELAAQGAARVVALDFSRTMLRHAARKRSASGLDRVTLLCGDAMRLPFRDASIDACTIGFGLRNFPDYEAAIHELARVVRPGGVLVILETTPFQGPLAPLLRFYFDCFVPWLGGLVSGDRAAYSYLPRSTAAFPTASELTALLRAAGFASVQARKLMAGTVALHIAVRAEAGQPARDAVRAVPGLTEAARR
ncbi:MAG: bifunctional demethylmenaquinone methyltransferase/2-methoxy-6-polyprenyl-1,4-benzoquinol methylase UbiE [Thermomicrobium sp.]|jgi:demethylmenaquinone methyltransferase/2-methoxy-6-polyprenyl-1,4-benzoquinol methylase|nr:bifunctional demethylmenaquinone methyltransferase/2-methoxy-6-polyprenyl-1,4-benzoquinol methylase UbiE [Thermomicrobium sp.]